MSYLRPSAIAALANLAHKTGETFTGDIVLDGSNIVANSGDRILFDPGTTSSPGLAVKTDQSTGITQSAPGTLNFVASNTVLLAISAGLVTIVPPLYATNGIQFHTNHKQDATTIVTTGTAQYVVTAVSTMFKAFKFFCMARIQGGHEVQVTEFLVVHDDTEITLTQYGDVTTDINLGSWTVDYSGDHNLIELVFVPATSTTLSVTATYEALA